MLRSHDIMLIILKMPPPSRADMSKKKKNYTENASYNLKTYIDLID
jgi:hypothetical protein